MIYAPWSSFADVDADAYIVPDGCRDVIVKTPPGGLAECETVECFFTDLDFSTRKIAVEAGEQFFGLRLKPGVEVSDRLLPPAFSNLQELKSFVENEICFDGEIVELIESLALGECSLKNGAHQLGVSIRTLQRRFRSIGLPPPDFWKQLSRARRADSAMFTKQPLVQVANDCGYSDQSHMTRDFIKWFGQSPGQVIRNPVLLGMLSEPGLGNWHVTQQNQESVFWAN